VIAGTSGACVNSLRSGSLCLYSADIPRDVCSAISSFGYPHPFRKSGYETVLIGGTDQRRPQRIGSVRGFRCGELKLSHAQTLIYRNAYVDLFYNYSERLPASDRSGFRPF